MNYFLRQFAEEGAPHACNIDCGTMTGTRTNENPDSDNYSSYFNIEARSQTALHASLATMTTTSSFEGRDQDR